MRRLLTLLAVLPVVWAIADGQIRGLPRWMRVEPALAKTEPIPAANVGEKWRHLYAKDAARSHLSIINVKLCKWYPVPSIGQRVVFCIAILQDVNSNAVSCWEVAISDAGQGLQAQRMQCRKVDLNLGKRRAKGPAA